MSVIKQKLDIEKVLQWAFGWELIKSRVAVAPDQIGTNYDHVLRQGEVGAEKVDDGVPRLPEALGVPHVDALIIETEVNLLQPTGVSWPQSVHKLLGDYAPLVYRSIDNLRHMAFKPAKIITLHAMKSSRPLWGEDDMPKPERIQAGNGKALVKFQSNTRHYLPARAYCPLEWSPSPTDILVERAEYFVWHSSLCLLANRLAGRLETYEALPPAASAYPWESGQVKPRILQGEEDRFARPAPFERPHPPLAPLKRPKAGPVRHIPVVDSGAAG